MRWQRGEEPKPEAHLPGAGKHSVTGREDSTELGRQGPGQTTREGVPPGAARRRPCGLYLQAGGTGCSAAPQRKGAGGGGASPCPPPPASRAQSLSRSLSRAAASSAPRASPIRLPAPSAAPRGRRGGGGAAAAKTRPGPLARVGACAVPSPFSGGTEAALPRGEKAPGAEAPEGWAGSRPILGRVASGPGRHGQGTRSRSLSPLGARPEGPHGPLLLRRQLFIQRKTYTINLPWRRVPGDVWLGPVTSEAPCYPAVLGLRVKWSLAAAFWAILYTGRLRSQPHPSCSLPCISHLGTLPASENTIMYRKLCIGPLGGSLIFCVETLPGSKNVKTAPNLCVWPAEDDSRAPPHSGEPRWLRLYPIPHTEKQPVIPGNEYAATFCVFVFWGPLPTRS
ncbi:PREDICTED: collagen alpha-1(III) chain-like [Hipposideros armiger]|uniref:Collagen alpha-1(III) chain-like n=1 Tax=Hipposideros armiger TaxID=186990 RepID=A0A8B7PU33_HIPAR|nr:PREDICTED: collagen alpha-1(III) chain-like [Hipposideros armiger]